MDEEYEEIINENDDEQFEEVKEGELVSERNVYERVGVARPGEALQLNIARDKGMKLDELNRKVHKMNLSEDEKFNILLGIHLEQLSEYIKGVSLEALNDLVSKVKYIHYKNPIGFILGFYVLKNKEIQRDKLEYVSRSVLKNISDVKVPDIIRYSRMFQKILQN